jgi:DHA1 family tetracycline resistance protein-like MFS transporter
VLLVSLLAFGVNYGLMGLAPSLPWLFLGRALTGISGAAYAPASAFVADVTPPEKRAQSFGLMGAANAIGFVIGPAIGGLLGGINLRLPFALAAALNLMNFVYGLVVVPESLASEHRRPFSLRRTNPFSSLVNLRRHPIVLGLMGPLLCFSLGQAILQSVWALHGTTRFGWSESEVGISLTMFGVACVFVQGGLLGVMMPRLGARRALLVGLTLSVISFVAFGAATQGWMMYTLVILLALSTITSPAAQSLISSAVGPSEQGELQGSLTLVGSMTSIVGPLLGTYLFARFSTEGAVPHIAGAAFFAGACLNACALLFAVRLVTRMPEVMAASPSPPAPAP